MHRRGLQCVADRATSSYSIRCYSTASSSNPSPSSKLKKRPPRKGVVGDIVTDRLVKSAAFGAKHVPQVESRERNKARRSGSAQTAGAVKEPAVAYPVRGGEYRYLENAIRRANTPGNLPSPEKVKFVTTPESELDELQGFAVGSDVNVESIRSGAGSFIEMRR